MSDKRIKVIQNGTLIDGTGADPVPGSVVVVEGTTIKQVGRVGQVEMPKGDVQTIDARGKTVMPAMADVHVHLCYRSIAGVLDFGLNEPIEHCTLWAAQTARLYLDHGFVNVRDVGTRGLVSLAVRDAINKGWMDGPRIKTAGKFICSTGGLVDFFPHWIDFGLVPLSNHFYTLADGADEYVKAVRHQVKEGVDLVKLEATGTPFSPKTPMDMQTATAEELQAASEEAKRKGRMVCIHAEGLQGVKNALTARPTTIEHGMQIDDEALETWTHTETMLVPTLANYFNFFTRGPELGLDRRVIDEHKRHHETHVKSIFMAYEAGIKIAIGSDSGTLTFDHAQTAQELELYVEHGMKPMDALLTITRNGAEAMGVGDRSGTVTPGKWADLLVVDGDPLQDVSILRDRSRILAVMKEGRLIRG